MAELMKILEGWDGYSAISEMKKPGDWENKLKEAVDLLSNAKGMPQHRHEYLLREALTTSDFPFLFGDVLDRQVLATYKAIEPEWKKYMKISTVNRLFPHIGGRRFAIANTGMVLDEVAEKGEYRQIAIIETPYNVFARKYGNRIDISWEAMLADDLGALKNTPAEMAWLAANTEHFLAVSSYAGDLGTHAAGNLYQTGVNSAALPLTIANLETAVAAMQAFRHPSGQPMRNRPKYLVVSDGGLEFTARQILTSATKMWVQRGATDAAALPFPTANVIAQYGLELVVDPWLSIVAGGAGHTRRSWYLFADPTLIAAIECDYLKGHERPEICMKAGDKVSIGGGDISPMAGDFESDNILYRVRQCFGANKMDWRATYYSRVAD
ncbi:MAG: hypothetical protein DDT41_01438 [candidate division WS2 bacterium]|nr:hypothetical protein [Candidatus Psychracetigena formicireducens]